MSSMKPILSPYSVILIINKFLDYDELEPSNLLNSWKILLKVTYNSSFNLLDITICIELKNRFSF